jgi:hypothetical protein
MSTSSTAHTSAKRNASSRRRLASDLGSRRFAVQPSATADGGHEGTRPFEGLLTSTERAISTAS